VSLNDVSAFFEHLERDPRLARRFSLSASPDSAASFAAREGYEFSPGELVAWLNERYARQASGELSDDQLQKVAGGAAPWSPLLESAARALLGKAK
jgi:predicted ribosomally synthesized peptide with nif11-like leader